MTRSVRQILTTPGKGHMTLLTSFRRDGTGVSTLVVTVALNDRLYFMTAADAWKAKRLARNPHVTVAPDTFKGDVPGSAVGGTARRLSGSEVKRARDLLRRGVRGRFWNLIFDWRNPGEKTAVYEISLEAEDANHEMVPSTHSLCSTLCKFAFYHERSFK
jgi:PPOX class probable F420-dependent enzyme